MKSSIFKSILIVLCCWLSSSAGFAQFSAGPNDTINPGVPVTLTATYGETGIPVTYVEDDDVRGPFPIGFNFMFFGTIYSHFWVGANGWISFSPNRSSSGRRDVFALPNPGLYNPKNCIFGPLADFTPNIFSDYIFYHTMGQSPDRKLIVMWCQVPLFSCSSVATFQIILHEGTNIIENQIFSKPQCPDNYKATLGVQDSVGIIGFAVPGRNATSWSAEKEGWQYNPVSADSFAVASIPYNLVPLVPGDKITYSWYEGSTFISNEQTITVSPSQTTVYRATMTLCVGDQFETTVKVVVLPRIPNGFSPNGDGVNDEFRIIGLPAENITKYNLQVFNRWGQVVFTSTNILESWDGKMNGQNCPEGLYCWAIYYEENNKAKVSNKGTVMLIR